MNRTVVLLALVVVGSAARAQCLLYGWPIPQAAQVLTAGDVDLDGTPDFLIPCPGSTLHGLIGRVHVRSGRTGAELLVVTGGPTPDGFGGRAVALGDVDHDGRSDFAVSAAARFSNVPSYVRVYSGATGAVIWEVNQTHYPLFLLGRSLARVGDLDQDGLPDLVVGAPAYATGNGHAFVLSGASGSLVLDFSATAGITAEFGYDVASASDLDQDGIEDVLVADPGAGASSGRVTVHSGSTGQVLLAATLEGFHIWGLHPATLGDVSGDGVVDYAIGCPSQIITPGETSGRLRFVSGADGSEFLRVDAAPGEQSFADSVDRISDHDGDGLADVLITAGFRSTGCCNQLRNDLRVLSSATGATIVGGQFRSYPMLETLPDADGNGMEDIGIPGAEIADGFGCGVVLSGRPLPNIVSACDAKQTSQGCTPQLRAFGTPSPTVGDDLVLHVRAALPNTFGVLLSSTHGTVMPFAGGRLCVAAPVRRSRVVASVVEQAVQCGSSSGATLSWRFTKSDIASMGGQPGGGLHVQAWFRDPGFAAPNDVGLTSSMVVTIWF